MTHGSSQEFMENVVTFRESSCLSTERGALQMVPRGNRAQLDQVTPKPLDRAVLPGEIGVSVFLGPDAIKILNSIAPLFCSHAHKQPSSNLAHMELASQVHTMMGSSIMSIAHYKLVNRCSDFIPTS